MFGFYVNEGHVNYWDFHHPDKWRTLIHVCRRWRSLVFISPRHLKVQLSRLTTLWQAVGNDEGLDVEVIDVEQEVGKGKAKDAEGE